MADIRINALATTAASTASDDFIAVDGSANGTRKLNAYSPTFGGNLTVSGTGTSSVAGSLAVGSASTTNTFTNSANGFTVNSATGNALAVFNSSAADAGITNNAYITLQTGGVARWYLGQSISAADGNFQIYGAVFGAPILTLNKTTGATTLAGNLTVNGGKVLISYPSSSQARVSFGGAHFDANSSYASYIRGYSSSATTAGLDFYTTYGSSVLALSLSEQGNATLAGNLTVSGGTITSGTGTLTLNSSANTVVLQSAGTTALTLDSSQNAKFAGNINVGNANNDADIRLHLNAAGDTSAKFAALWRNASSIKIFHLRADGDLYTLAGATITGALAIGNTVNTVSPTSPNRTITMVIGGTTYYIHAKTTND